MTRTAGKFRIVIANAVWRSTGNGIASITTFHRNDKKLAASDCHALLSARLAMTRTAGKFHRNDKIHLQSDII
jgi:hypothetical protein